MGRLGYPFYLDGCWVEIATTYMNLGGGYGLKKNLRLEGSNVFQKFFSDFRKSRVALKQAPQTRGPGAA
jgi:hypothetical protein